MINIAVTTSSDTSANLECEKTWDGVIIKLSEAYVYE